MHKKKFAFTFFLILSTGLAFSQKLEKYDSYEIDNLYEKVNLEEGTLDEDGDKIDFVFREIDYEAGRFRVEITDGPGDLYKVKEANLYFTFDGYYGYAGYGDEGVLEISDDYGSSDMFYKVE